VLVSAYACEPDKGSEPGVGWNWVKQISKFADTWVITRSNNKMVIVNELSKNPETNLHFIYVDFPSWMRFWKKGQRGVHLYYYLWQLRSYYTAKKLCEENRFDVAHHLTFGVFSYPSALSLLGVPFVWGPVGGIDRVPVGLNTEIGLRGRLFEIIRCSSHKALYYFDPFVRCTVRKSDVILCRTKETHDFLGRGRKKQHVLLMLETGKPSLPEIGVMPQNNDCYRIFFAGRLIPLKGVELAIKSFKILADSFPDSLFEIAGDGFEKKKLERFAENLGISRKVVFLGERPREEALRKMATCHVFLYPSLREGGTWALMEAMALGKPVICLDHSGPGDMVTDECGIKIKPVDAEQTIQKLGEALKRLANDPGLRVKMGQAGRKRVQEVYSWEKKGEFIHKVYMEILGSADPSGS